MRILIVDDRVVRHTRVAGADRGGGTDLQG